MAEIENSTSCRWCCSRRWLRMKTLYYGAKAIGFSLCGARKNELKIKIVHLKMSTGESKW